MPPLLSWHSIASAVAVMSPQVHTENTVQNPLLALVPDRKQLEHERLQRVAARERQHSRRKRSRSASYDSSASIDTQEQSIKQARLTAPSQRYTPVSSADRFWNGAVKVRLFACVTPRPPTIDIHARLVQEHG